jgi:hypothetical protein
MKRVNGQKRDQEEKITTENIMQKNYTRKQH